MARQVDYIRKLPRHWTGVNRWRIGFEGTEMTVMVVAPTKSAAVRKARRMIWGEN